MVSCMMFCSGTIKAVSAREAVFLRILLTNLLDFTLQTCSKGTAPPNQAFCGGLF